MVQGSSMQQEDTNAPRVMEWTMPIQDRIYQYNPPYQNQTTQYYDLNAILDFQNSDRTHYLKDELNDVQSQLLQYQMTYQIRWMPLFQDLEISLKAILTGRAIVDLGQYLQKKVIPIMDVLMAKLIIQEDHLRPQIYFSEILLIVQQICLDNWEKYPQIVLSIFRKLFSNSQNIPFYDSRFQDQTFYPVLNNFYLERELIGIKSMLSGRYRENPPNDYNKKIFYPLAGEVMDQQKMQQNTYHLSPLQRIQLHYFYLNGGFEKLNQSMKQWTLQNMDILEILHYMENNLDRQFYIQTFEPIKNDLVQIHLKLTEEDIKNANKDIFQRLSLLVDRILQHFFDSATQKQIMGVQEMQILTLCFRCSNLEKRIFGLQQFCEKILTAQENDQNVKNYSYLKDEWYTSKNVLQFFVEYQIFNDLFGEKAHFELIKRSFPLIRFLYKNKELKKEGIIQMIRMVNGKHETWTNMIFKILNNIAEILYEQDMESVLQEIKTIKIDQNILDFLKAMGRNKVFEKIENKISQKKKKQNENILQDLEEQNEENINRLKNNDLIIKVHNEAQMESQYLQFRKPGDRRYQQNQNQQGQFQPQQQQKFQDESDDGSNEYEDGTRGRIVQYLLDIVHEFGEIGNQAFNIACQLICNQFRSLREKYLLYAFDMLFQNDPPLPPTQYMTLIQKIIQSSYPLDQFRSQQDLIKWLDSKFNFKISLLALLGRIKRRNLEKQIENLNNYIELVDAILKFYFYLFQASDTKIESSQLRIMWQLLVENAIIQQEQDVFFTWLHNINMNQLDQEAQQLLFFEYLIKVEYNSYTIQMLNCLTSLIIYFNVQYRILKSEFDTYTINNYELIGIEIVWRLLYECDNQEISQKAFQFLLSITKFKPSNQNIQNQIKEYYIQKVFASLKDNNIGKSLDLCLKLLEDLEGLRTMKNNDKGEKIAVRIENRCKGSMEPKRQDILINSGMTIGQVKQQICSKLVPLVKPEEIDIVCRGQWLHDNKQIKDYKFDSKITFIISSKQQTDEDQAQKLYGLDGIQIAKFDEAIPLPHYVQLIDNKVNEPSQSDILSKTNQVIDFTGEQDLDFIKFVLAQKQWNEDNAISDILDNKDQLMVEYHEKTGKIQQQQQQQKVQKKQDNNVCLATLISENHQYMTLLFDVLNLNDQQLNQKVWLILQLIPRNKEIYEMIDQCLKDANWERLIDLENPHKLYYNLQILKELLECDMIEDLEECKKRRECREKFLKQGALSQIVQLVLIYVDSLETNLLSTLLSIYQIYSNAYALSQVSQTDEFMSLMNLKDTIKQFYKQFEDKIVNNHFLANVGKHETKSIKQLSSNSNSQTVSSNITPQFNSQCPTPPPDDIQNIIPENKKQAQDEFKLLVQGFKEDPQMFNSFQVDWYSFIPVLIRLIPKNLEQVFSILLTTLYLKPSLLLRLYDIPELSTQFAIQLTESPSEELRRMVAVTIMTICELRAHDNMEIEDFDQQDEIFNNDMNQIRDFRTYFLEQYIPILEKVQTEYEDFYVVIANLLTKTNKKELQNKFNFNLLFSQLKQFIIDRPVIEERFGENEDKVAQGYLILLTTLLEIEPQLKEQTEGLTREIYDYLFHLSDDYQKYPKFKRRITRKRGFQLLIEICKGNEDNFLQILEPIMKNHEKFDPSEIDYDTGVKGTHGFVGLRNLGATCYINSLLQQFFMNKAFRSGILNSQIMIKSQIPLIGFEQKEQDVYLFDNIVDHLENYQIRNLLKDHPLFQLQQVFIQLQESVRQFIVPQQLIQSIKGYDNQPINVIVQQDVNEFFNLLTDKIEQNQKHTNQQNLIHHVMGGLYGNEIRSIESDCEFVKEADEPFLTVTIEIKHKKSLEEALDLFIKPDLLEGENQYQCEEMGRKLDAQKRCYFKKLPNTFVFTLKRFEFDYNTMLKQKVNDYFEFPPEINMFKWTKDNIIDALHVEDQSEYQYKLKGVLVHTGHAESGHYYSYISQGDKWFLFDDKFVTPFKFENLKDECFGGHHENASMYDWDTFKSKNAYLLFYERVNFKPEMYENQQVLDLKKKVTQENSIYLKNQLFYSPDYLCFIKDFICQYNFQEFNEVFPIISYSDEMLNFKDEPNSLVALKEMASIKVIKLITLFSYETLMKNKDYLGFVNSMQTILTLYEKVIPASFWLLDYLTQNRQMLIDILFEQNQMDVRVHFVKLLTLCIQTVHKVEYQYINEIVWINDRNYPKSSLERFLEVYIDDLFLISKKNLKKSTEYFLVIKLVVTMSPRIIRRIYEKKNLQNFYQLFKDTLNDNIYGNMMNLSKLNEKGLDSPMAALIDIICKIITGSRTDGMKYGQLQSPFYLFEDKQIYTDLDQQICSQICLLHDYKKYIVTMVQLTQQSVIEMTKHLCWNTQTQSQQIMGQMLYMLLENNLEWQYIDTIFHVVENLIKIEDQFQKDRIDTLFRKTPSYSYYAKSQLLIDAIQNSFDNDKNYSFSLMACITELANYKPFQQYLIQKTFEFKQILTRMRIAKQYLYNPFTIPTNKINKSIRQLEILLGEEPTEYQQIEIEQQQENLLESNDEKGINDLIQQNHQHYSGANDDADSTGVQYDQDEQNIQDDSLPGIM